MEDCLAVAEQLKESAKKILVEYKILELLEKYGKPFLTGSYVYNVMTLPDIDVCLELDSISTEIAFVLGKELAKIPTISTMYFRNEFVLHTVGNPLAIFWCIELFDSEKKTWKIDLLMSTHQEISRVLKYGEDLTKGLNETKRQIIIKIKSILSTSPEYRRKIRSVDIYRAVIQDNITSLDEWNKWMQTNIKK